MPHLPASRPGTALVRWADADTQVLNDPTRRTPHPGEVMVHLCVYGDDSDPHFPAIVTAHRAPGDIAPLFRREVAEAVVAWCNTEHRAAPDCHRVWWQGDTIVLHSPAYTDDPGYTPERVGPDRYGRYAIGADWWWHLPRD